MNKDSPEGRRPPCLALHGCQESRGSQVHHGPPEKRKQHSQDVSSGQERAKVQGSSFPPTVWTTPSSQHLSQHLTPHAPWSSSKLPASHSVQHAWTTVTNCDPHLSAETVPRCCHGSRCAYNNISPPQVTTISSFTELSPCFSCHHPELTPELTMQPHFNPIPTSSINEFIILPIMYQVPIFCESLSQGLQGARMTEIQSLPSSMVVNRV